MRRSRTREVGLCIVSAFVAVSLVGACSGGGAVVPDPEDSATASSGSSSGTTSSGSSGSTSSSSSTSSSGGADASSDVVDAAKEAACVPTSYQIAFVPPGGGSACSFKFNKPYTPGLINLLLTPGWGTVCYAGSSSNCGSGASADGWWFSAADEISLCDASCTRFYNQPAGKLTVRLGCATQNCTH